MHNAINYNCRSVRFEEHSPFANPQAPSRGIMYKPFYVA